MSAYVKYEEYYIYLPKTGVVSHGPPLPRYRASSIF